MSLVYAAGVFGWPTLQGLAAISSELTKRGHEIEMPDHTASQDVKVLRQVHVALLSEAVAV